VIACAVGWTNAGCLDRDEVDCRGGRVCPIGRVCVPSGCALPEQLAPCAGQADRQSCTFMSQSAVCIGGVCEADICGNGVVAAPEECDDGAGNSDSPDAACRPDCHKRRCGGGIVDVAAGEVCDNGTNLPSSGCSYDCKSNETCGNGFVDAVKRVNGVQVPNEECDDGNLRGQDGCSSTCEIESPHWRLIQSSQPSPRGSASLVYDARRGRTVLFGGFTIARGDFSDLWQSGDRSRPDHARDHQVEREVRPEDRGRSSVRAASSLRPRRARSRDPLRALPAQKGTLMTVVETSIRINAKPDRVRAVLASLDALDRYDPGVKKSEVISTTRDRSGAERKCELAPGGWFKERVADWKPTSSLGFERSGAQLSKGRLRSLMPRTH
jgi:cysteine-rich repeat protein